MLVMIPELCVRLTLSDVLFQSCIIYSLFLVIIKSLDFLVTLTKQQNQTLISHQS